MFEIDWQSAMALLCVAVAAVVLCRRAYRMLTQSTGSGCGSGCGQCASPVEQQTGFISLEELHSSDSA